jgi:site-specific recombinase XerD
LIKRLGNRFLPGNVAQDHIRDYLMWLSEVGHQRPNGPSARARALAAIRSFFKYAHRAGLLRDNPAVDVPLPKIRMGEVRACLTMSVIVFCGLSEQIQVLLEKSETGQ